jgi:hypothetical protein
VGRIEVWAKNDKGWALEVNVQVYRNYELVDTGRTNKDYSGWWISKELEEGYCFVIARLKWDGRMFENSHNLQLEGNLASVHFGPAWNLMSGQGMSSRNRSPHQSDGTKIYGMSQKNSEEGTDDSSTVSREGETRCTSCGVTNSRDAKYCKECGRRL